MSALDLTSLADCKAWLGLTSTTDDALIAALVTGVSQAILADLGRPHMLPTLVAETFDGGGESALALRHWPVTQIVAVTIDEAAIAASSQPGQPGWVVDAADAAPPGMMQRLHLRGGLFSPGSQNVVVAYRAGYQVTGEAAIVPFAAPFTLTAQAPFGPWASDAGVMGTGAPYTAVAGLYTFAAADAGAAVTLAYGYVPTDLSHAACEWVADRYAARSRIGQSAKTLGGQETTSFIVKAMPDVVDRLVRPYRRVAA